MSDLNVCVFVGRLTADPESEMTSGGKSKTKFRIAVNRSFRDLNGDLTEEATFLPVSCYGKQADNIAKYMRKGSPVSVSGRLRTYSFTGKDGETVRGFEIVANDVGFLSSGKGKESSSGTLLGGELPDGEESEVQF